MVDSPVFPAQMMVRMLLPALKAVFKTEQRTRNRWVDAINLQAIRAGSRTGAFPADENQLPVPFWPSFGERSLSGYQRTSATEAVLSRVDEKNPYQSKTVKAILQ